MVLAKQLKKLLKEQDLSVAAISRSTKVSSKAIYSWLDGGSPKNINDLKKVALKLGVSLDYLIYDEEPKVQNINLANIKDELNLGNFEIILRKPKQ